MKLKAYLRLSYNLKFLPSKKYEIWSGKSVELGRMVGGWIKSTKKRLTILGIGYSGCRSAGAGGTMAPTPAFSTSI
ncbi:four helix bundle protein [Sellimonas intestinalis]